MKPYLDQLVYFFYKDLTCKNRCEGVKKSKKYVTIKYLDKHDYDI